MAAATMVLVFILLGWRTRLSDPWPDSAYRAFVKAQSPATEGFLQLFRIATKQTVLLVQNTGAELIIRQNRTSLLRSFQYGVPLFPQFSRFGRLALKRQFVQLDLSVSAASSCPLNEE